MRAHDAVGRYGHDQPETLARPTSAARATVHKFGGFEHVPPQWRPSVLTANSAACRTFNR